MRRSCQLLEYRASEYTKEVTVAGVTVEVDVICAVCGFDGGRVPLHVQGSALMRSVEHIRFVTSYEEDNLLRITNI